MVAETSPRHYIATRLTPSGDYYMHIEGVAEWMEASAEMIRGMGGPLDGESVARWLTARVQALRDVETVRRIEYDLTGR